MLSERSRCARRKRAVFPGGPAFAMKRFEENTALMTVDPFRRAIDRVKANRLIARVLEVNGRFDADGGGYLCAAITYYAFLSLFPLILLGASVAGFVLAGDRSRQ